MSPIVDTVMLPVNFNMLNNVLVVFNVLQFVNDISRALFFARVCGSSYNTNMVLAHYMFVD